jgi:1,2-diacylglycerol 3-alpha-glucosyltransferase
MGEKAVSHFVQNRLGKVYNLIAPTKKVADSLTEYGLSGKIHIIPTGIDLAKFEKRENKDTLIALKTKLGIPLDSPVLISIGRLAQEKNSDELVRNFVEILKWNRNVVMLFVGDGPFREKLEHMANSLKISDNIIFTGMIAPSEIALYYQLGTIFVSASQSETQGLTYIEALASELPVVCRYDECIEDVVVAGYDGFPYMNDEEYLQAIKTILGDTKLLGNMKKNASLQSKRYSFSRFGSDIEKLYLDSIAQNRINISRENNFDLN